MIQRFKIDKNTFIDDESFNEMFKTKYQEIRMQLIINNTEVLLTKR